MVVRHRSQTSVAHTCTATHKFLAYSPSRGYYYDTASLPTYQFVNSSVCDDSTHPSWASGIGDTGGNLHIVSTKYTVQGFSYQSGSTGDMTTATGIAFNGLLYDSASMTGVGLNPYSPTELMSLGATAIARTMPTNPSFSLSQAIGEIRQDGLPRLPAFNLIREKARYLRNSGDEYLNVEFGWLPLVNDLRRFANSVKHSETILNQFRKDSDTKIRRRYSFPGTSSSASATSGTGGVGGAIPWPDTRYYNGFGSNGVHTISASREAWFSGAFRYHIPGGDDLSSKMSRWSAEADKLLGLRLTPEVVYNLTPWSWALDWFTNTGDIVHNISALGHDALVLQYGYIMGRATSEEFTSGTAANGQTGSVRIVSKDLKRQAATPYGFGFNMSGLSPSQDAILVALGLSKGLR